MKNLYAILDLVSAQLIGSPFLYTHDAPAVRVFTDLINDTKTMVGHHPADHNLIALGLIDITRDDQTISVNLLPEFRTVVTGLAILAIQPPKPEEE